MKFKLTFTATVEYEPTLVDYEDATTPEEMLEIDIESSTADPYIFLDNAEIIVTGEIIER